MREFKISAFEYLPGTERHDDDFTASLRKINSGSGENGIYALDIPFSTYAKIPDPMIVFLPHTQGFNDLEENPRFCPGGLAVQVEVSNEKKRLDFATVVQCLAQPI